MKNCQKIGMYPENTDTYDSELSQHNVHVEKKQLTWKKKT